jgi:hypothetical protein
MRFLLENSTTYHYDAYLQFEVSGRLANDTLSASAMNEPNEI